jgi:uncharacterized membrane protein
VPGRGGYLAAALIALASAFGIFGLIAWLVLSASGHEQFLAPGRHAVVLGEGTHLVWNDHRTLFGGRAYDEPEALPRGAEITVTEQATGQAVPVLPHGGSSMTSGATRRTSAARIDIGRAGRYEVAVSGSFTPRVFSVSENFLPRTLWSIAAIVVLLFAGMGGSLALFAWTYLRRELAAGPLPAAPGASTQETSLRRVAAIVYGLQVASIFLGVTLFAGVLINYLKLREAEGTWIASHFRWQMRTFWLTLLGLAVGLATAVLLVGIVVLMGTGGWMLYRALKGWLELADGRPVRA